MFKKIITLFLIGLILNLTFSSTAYPQTQTKEEKNAKRIKNVLSIIENKLDGKIEIKLLDKTKILGQLKDYDDDSLTVIEKDTNKITKIPYSQIKSVEPWISKKRTAKLILITVAVIGFLALIAKGMQDY
jgi:uncharacterized membrane protein